MANRILVTLLAGGVLLAAGAAWAEGSGSVQSDAQRPEVLAKFQKEAEAKTQCPPLEGRDKQMAAYQAGADKKWDRAAMACAVGYGTQAALAESMPSSVIWAVVTFRTGNIEDNLKVLGSNVEYFDVLARSYSDLYQGVETATELALRWNQAGERSKALIARMEPLMDGVPEARILRAANGLASTVKNVSPKAQQDAVAAAVKDLEITVKAKPGALDGLGEFLLGQALSQLPEFLGGDPERGIKLLEEANRLNPNDLAVVHALADAYLGERQTDKALALMQKALTTDPGKMNPQDYLDQIKYLGGLATRLRKTELAARFADVAKATLKEKPYLLARNDSGAAFGHSRENPITGQDPDALK